MLRERAFAYTRYSEVLAEMLREQGRQVNRSALQEIDQEVHRDPGQRWLSDQLLLRLPTDAKLIVVDGLRFPEDHAFFAERYGPNFLHWHIEAPRKMRSDRYLAMGFTEADFEHVTSHPVEGGIPALAKLAHLRLDNSGTLEAFDARVLESVAAIEQRVAV
jgi:dephospho-CoA kinase